MNDEIDAIEKKQHLKINEASKKTKNHWCKMNF